MVQNSSAPLVVRFEACTSCGFAVDSFGFLGFEKWGPMVLAWAARIYARNEIAKFGIEPEEDMDPERDPYYSLLRDLTKTYSKDLQSMPDDKQRYLAHRFVRQQPIEVSDRQFDSPPEMVRDYLAIQPKIFAR